MNYQPKQKPTKNAYLALCVITQVLYKNNKNLTGKTRESCLQTGLASSVFVVDVLCRQQNLCLQSQSVLLLL